MPEGDTVYQSARRLDAALAGQVVTTSDFRVPAYATVDLSGEPMHSVASRGKHLLMRIGDDVLHSHLKMEGEWRVHRPGERWRRPGLAGARRDRDAGRGRRRLRPRAGRGVPGVRRRPIGSTTSAPTCSGPTGMPPRRCGASPRAPTAPIAVALGEQRNLAGLGNVYVNELCFLRGIRPTRPAGEVDLPPLVDLASRVIRANRDRISRMTTGNDRRGERLWVYSRGGEPCRRCGTRIEHGRLGRNELELRDTWWCPNCQR